MPAFSRPTASALHGFAVFCVVHEPGPTVDIRFRLTLVNSEGVNLGELNEDLRPYLTAQQQTNFENATLALYAQAVTELVGG